MQYNIVNGIKCIYKEYLDKIWLYGKLVITYFILYYFHDDWSSKEEHGEEDGKVHPPNIPLVGYSQHLGILMGKLVRRI